jgi:hypothetical protein
MGAELESFAGETSDDNYEYNAEGYEHYRSLSIAAVATLLFGILSLASFAAAVLLIIPAVGTALGLFAVWTTYTRRDEFTGQRLAATGLGLSAFMLVVGTAIQWYFNRVTVPEHYKGKEVAFFELQPEEDIDLNELQRLRSTQVDLPLPPRADELNGKQVFITGYVYPGTQQKTLKKFVLVPDMKTCCFGGQPKLTDMIEVTLKDPLRVDLSWKRRGIGGVLKVHKSMQSREQLTGVVYELQADYLSEGPGKTGSASEG